MYGFDLDIDTLQAREIANRSPNAAGPDRGRVMPTGSIPFALALCTTSPGLNLLSISNLFVLPYLTYSPSLFIPFFLPSYLALFNPLHRALNRFLFTSHSTLHAGPYTGPFLTFYKRAAL